MLLATGDAVTVTKFVETSVTRLVVVQLLEASTTAFPKLAGTPPEDAGMGLTVLVTINVARSVLVIAVAVKKPSVSLPTGKGDPDPDGRTPVERPPVP